MSAATIIFPHQLFRNPPTIHPGIPVYLVEEKLFFTQYRFHKQKLALHRASMKYYENWLQAKGTEVIYIEAQQAEADIRQLMASLASQGITTIRYIDPVDDFLGKRIEKAGGHNRHTCMKQKVI